ncbi:hypothetical protein CLU79DRAFT_839398 [Phycomyces nitens]|nr:hypothetical protein CLU79DRAFT_839398 [Phycomyces nitens]
MLDWLSTWLSPQDQQQQQETYRHGLDQYEEDGDWIQVSPVPKEPQQLQPIPKEAIVDEVPKVPPPIKNNNNNNNNNTKQEEEENTLNNDSSAKHLSRQERRHQARMALKEKKVQTRPTPCRPNAPVVNHCLPTRTMSIEC